MQLTDPPQEGYSIINNQRDFRHKLELHRLQLFLSAIKIHILSLCESREASHYSIILLLQETLIAALVASEGKDVI